MKASVKMFADFNRVNKLFEGFSRTTGLAVKIADVDGTLLSRRRCLFCFHLFLLQYREPDLGQNQRQPNTCNHLPDAPPGCHESHASVGIK